MLAFADSSLMHPAQGRGIDSASDVAALFLFHNPFVENSLCRHIIGGEDTCVMEREALEMAL